jgi:hypothetical protein
VRCDSADAPSQSQPCRSSLSSVCGFTQTIAWSWPVDEATATRCLRTARSSDATTGSVHSAASTRCQSFTIADMAAFAYAASPLRSMTMAIRAHMVERRRRYAVDSLSRIHRQPPLARPAPGVVGPFGSYGVGANHPQLGVAENRQEEIPTELRGRSRWLLHTSMSGDRRIDYNPAMTRGGHVSSPESAVPRRRCSRPPHSETHPRGPPASRRTLPSRPDRRSRP